MPVLSIVSLREGDRTWTKLSAPFPRGACHEDGNYPTLLDLLVPSYLGLCRKTVRVRGLSFLPSLEFLVS